MCRFHQKVKKVLTKRKKADIINKLSDGRQEKIRKLPEKTSEKGLTKGREYDII